MFHQTKNKEEHSPDEPSHVERISSRGLRVFQASSDALFNTVDALRIETAAHSFPELSLSPLFQRRWPSLYETFEDDKIDAEKLRQIFVQFAPHPGSGKYVFLGVDTSNVSRREAETSVDRTLVPLPNLSECDHAVCSGWVISSIVLLPEEAGQGTFVLDTKPRGFFWAGDAGRGQPSAVRGRSVGAAWLAPGDQRLPLVRLRSVSGAHGRGESQLSVARQMQSRLLPPPSPAGSAWSQSQRWSAFSMQR